MSDQPTPQEVEEMREFCRALLRAFPGREDHGSRAQQGPSPAKNRRGSCAR